VPNNQKSSKTDFLKTQDLQFKDKDSINFLQCLYVGSMLQIVLTYLKGDHKPNCVAYVGYLPNCLLILTDIISPELEDFEIIKLF
jgi:hypothetical protein